MPDKTNCTAADHPMYPLPSSATPLSIMAPRQDGIEESLKAGPPRPLAPNYWSHRKAAACGNNDDVSSAVTVTKDLSEMHTSEILQKDESYDLDRLHKSTH